MGNVAEEILLFLSKDGGSHKLARDLPALPAGTEVIILSLVADEGQPAMKPGIVQRLFGRLSAPRALPPTTGLPQHAYANAAASAPAAPEEPQ